LRQRGKRQREKRKGGKKEGDGEEDNTAPKVKFIVSSDELREGLAVIFRNIHGRDADDLLEDLVREQSRLTRIRSRLS